VTIKPEETGLTQPYWQAARRGVVLLQHCNACGTYWHPPQPTCPDCLASSYEWAESSGRGELYSYTTVHHAAHPAVVDALPYVVALVTVEEGPNVICNFLGPAPPTVGLPIRLALGPTPGGMELPQAYSIAT
jgi:uncharacterized OB-fold protein